MNFKILFIFILFVYLITCEDENESDPHEFCLLKENGSINEENIIYLAAIDPRKFIFYLDTLKEQEYDIFDEIVNLINQDKGSDIKVQIDYMLRDYPVKYNTVKSLVGEVSMLGLYRYAVEYVVKKEKSKRYQV